MANGEFLELQSAKTYEECKKINDLLIQMASNVKKVNLSAINTPSASGDATAKLTADLKAQQVVIGELQAKLLALSASQRNYVLSTTSQTNATKGNTSATRENSIANQILRAEFDRNYRANTLLAGAYARASARLLILKKEAKDTAIAFGAQSVQAKNAAKAASELDGRIKAADASVGDYQRNVGNYAGGVVKGFQSIFSYVRQLAYILPGIGIAGIFSLALDPIFKAVKGLGLFNDELLELRNNLNQFSDTQANIRKETQATQEQFASLYKLATNPAKPEEQAAAVRKLKSEYASFFGTYSDGAIKSGEAAKELDKINQSIFASKIVNEQNDYKKKTEERIDLIQQELKDRIKYREEAERLNEVIKQNTQFLGRGQYAVTEQGKAAQKQLDILKDERKERKKYLEEKKEENILNKTDSQLQSDLISLNLRRQRSIQTYNAYLGQSLLLEKDINKVRAAGRQYDPQGAILDAKIRYMKELTEANDAEFEASKKNKEREISNLEEVAGDEKRTFEARVNAYGEMLKKRQDLLADDIARTRSKMDERLKIELDEAEKAYQAELKKAAPKDASKRTAEQAAAVVKITEYYEGEKLSIRLKYQDLTEQADIENSKQVQLIAKQTSAALVKIEEERTRLIASTDKIYRDQQSAMFKKTAENEKLSVEVRQAAFNASIALRQKQIDIDKAAELLASSGNKEEYDNIIAKYEGIQRLLDNEKKETSPFSKQLAEANAELERLRKNLSSDQFKGAGLSSLEKLFDGTFKKIMDGFDKITKETQEWPDQMDAASERALKKFQYTFETIAEIAVEAFSFIERAQQANFDAQYTRLERQKEIAIAFAGDSATAREEIERQYDERRRQIQRQQAEAEKRTAIFKIILNTASAVVAALPNIPLSIIMGALGAIQLGVVASAPIPEYYKGTDNAPGGLAWTQERGAEIITDKQGRVKSTGSDKGAQLTQLSAGDKVYTAEQSQQIFRNNLDAMLYANGINSFAPVFNSPEFKNSPVVVNMPKQEAAPSRDHITLSLDETGLNKYIDRDNQRRNVQNARFRGKSYNS